MAGVFEKQNLTDGNTPVSGHPYTTEDVTDRNLRFYEQDEKRQQKPSNGGTKA